MVLCAACQAKAPLAIPLRMHNICDPATISNAVGLSRPIMARGYNEKPPLVLEGIHPVRGSIYAVVDDLTWLPYNGVLCDHPTLASLGPLACKEAAEAALAAAGATVIHGL